MKLGDRARLGALRLRNRVAMAPMTRSRAHADGRPGPSAALYYAQRASAGLLITEGTCISPQGVGNPNVPGLWDLEHVRAWRPVTDAVHAQGGTIVAQLWHTGRASHPHLQPGGGAPVGPSAVGIAGRTFTSAGWTEFVEPRALDVDEISGIVGDYVAAAHNAISAGFDGVELHGANGYLIDQFLHSGSNHRDDAYGGSIENRCRFLLKVVDAVAATVGSDRVGLRLSPSSSFYDMSDEDPGALYEHALGELGRRALAYLHLVEPGISGSMSVDPGQVRLDSAWVRPRWDGPLIAAGDYTAQTAIEALAYNRVDVVAFGRLFVSNPDLPERLLRGAPLLAPQRPTFYGGGDEGYIDYPSLAAEKTADDLVEAGVAGQGSAVLSGATPVEDWQRVWALQQASRTLSRAQAPS